MLCFGEKIAVEFNGLYWHREKVRSNKNYHYNKWLECQKQGIQLIQIWEDDWYQNPELVKQMLAHKLGVSSQPKIYARNTKIVFLENEQAKNFLNNNHIQGEVLGSIRLGLVTDTHQLVAVMVLKKEGKTLNLLRFATSQPVVGGFTKLLKHVEKTYKPEEIITFSDNCVSDGGFYMRRTGSSLPVK